MLISPIVREFFFFLFSFLERKEGGKSGGNVLVSWVVDVM